MKKLNFLTIMMVTLFTLSFVSCSSDDDEDELGSISEEIVGSWKGTYSNIYYCKLTFNSDGTGSGRREVYHRKYGHVMEYVDYIFTWGRKGDKVYLKGSYVAVQIEEEKTIENTFFYPFDYDGTSLTIREGTFGRITSFTKL